jgi:hypothetical protein
MFDWVNFSVSLPYPTWEFWQYWFLVGLILTPILVLRWSQLKRNSVALKRPPSKLRALFASLIIITFAPFLIIQVCFGLFRNRKSVMIKRELARKAKREHMARESIAYGFGKHGKRYVTPTDGKNIH